MNLSFKAGFKRMIVVVIVAGLLTVLPIFASAQSPQDVQANHWAYEAVMDLIERGYLGLSEGSFEGEQPVDRFTLASIISRILHEIETGSVGIQSQDDAELLRLVVNEFRADLVDVYDRLEASEQEITRQANELEVHRDNFSKVYFNLGELSDQLSELEELTSYLESELLMIETVQQAALQAETLEIRSTIDELREAIRAAEEGREAAVGQSLETQAEVIYVLDERLRDESLRLDDLEELLKGLGEELSGLTDGIEEAIIELRRESNAQASEIAAQRIDLVEQGRMLATTDGELLRGIEAALERTNALTGRVEAMERQLLSVEGQIGLSEAQLDAVTDHLMNEIESQYQHSFLFSGSVAEELQQLKDEFRSYRASTDQELRAARSGQMIGIAAAVIAVIALIAN